MNRLLMKYTALLLALLLCLGVIGCRPATQNGEDTTQGATEGTTQAIVEREPIVIDYEGDLTPGGTPEIRAEYADLVYVGKGMPAFYYTEEQAIDLLEQIEDLYVIFRAGTPEELRAAYDKVKSGALAEMETQEVLAKAEYNLYRNDPKAEENHLWMNALYNDASGRLALLYSKIYASPAAEVFFEGWSEAEIRAQVSKGKGYDEEVRALQSEKDALLVQYHELLQQEDYMETTAALYPELVRLNNAIAQKLGYDDYMDYAYECIYLREYTPDDIAQVRKVAKEQLMPLYNQVIEEMLALEEQILAESEEKQQALFDEMDARRGLTVDSEEFLSYIQSISESFGATYADLLEKEYYYMAYDRTLSYTTRYTDKMPSLKQPFLYLGASPVEAKTVIHEYGHYYAFSLDPGRTISYDLAELQSQGNEWMYEAYLSGQYDPISDRYVNLLDLMIGIDTVILCVCLDEFEQTVYANPEKYTDMESLDALYTEIVSGYTDPEMFTGPSYWRMVLFDWAGYYINYGISMIPCFELYYLAESDYESAAQTYLSLSDYEGTLTFSEVLERAGLQNPLDEEYQIFDLEVLLALMQQKQ